MADILECNRMQKRFVIVITEQLNAFCRCLVFLNGCNDKKQFDFSSQYVDIGKERYFYVNVCARALNTLKPRSRPAEFRRQLPDAPAEEAPNLGMEDVTNLSYLQGASLVTYKVDISYSIWDTPDFF